MVIVCHPLNCFFADILKPLSGKTTSHIKNLVHFVELIEGGNLSLMIVNFDVVRQVTNRGSLTCPK